MDNSNKKFFETKDKKDAKRSERRETKFELFLIYLKGRVDNYKNLLGSPPK